jgi:DUF4097 and DUF4098 domain-containing protein YvlB
MSLARKFILAALPLFSLALTGCGLVNSNQFTAEQTISKTFSGKSWGQERAPQLIVETFNGKIEATVSEGGGTIHVDVTKHAGGPTQEEADEGVEAIQVDMTQDKDAIRIRVHNSDEALFASRGASVALQVPVGTVFDLRTTNGNTSVIGLAGDVVAESTNGKMQVKGSTGQLQLTTSNGPIQVEGGARRVDAHTSNGSIQVHTAKAVINAQTSNGAINFEGQLPAGDHSLRTNNGRIVVALPADAQFRIDASTSHGGISNEFTLAETDESGKTHLKGSVGKDPVTSIKLETSNGKIEIKHEK